MRNRQDREQTLETCGRGLTDAILLGWNMPAPTNTSWRRSTRTSSRQNSRKSTCSRSMRWR